MISGRGRSMHRASFNKENEPDTTRQIRLSEKQTE